MGDEKTSLGVDEVGDLVETIEILCVGLRCQLDLERPALAAEVEDEIDFVAVAGSKKVGINAVAAIAGY